LKNLSRHWELFVNIVRTPREVRLPQTTRAVPRKTCVTQFVALSDAGKLLTKMMASAFDHSSENKSDKFRQTLTRLFVTT